MDFLNKLKEIEISQQIQILHACEAGSRAWGFLSPDSDYDIRFLYKRELDFYLSLYQQEDVIDLPIDGSIDLGGWDIRKALVLLRKSNIPLLEWINGPINYLEDDGFLGELKHVSQDFFSPIAGFHHYQNMAKKHVEFLEEDVYKLKHLFYALRAAFAARWIVRYQTFPPVNFNELADGLSEVREYKDEIEQLKALKAEKSESYRHPRNERIISFLQNIVNQNDENSGELEPSVGDAKVLDEFFINLVIS